MSKRILTGGINKPCIRNCTPTEGEGKDKGTNFAIMRVYADNDSYDEYAVIIADDNLFEGI